MSVKMKELNKLWVLELKQNLIISTPSMKQNSTANRNNQRTTVELAIEQKESNYQDI